MSPDAGPSPSILDLYAAERRHEWFDFRIDGWSAWRVLRMPVYNVAAALPIEHPFESRADQIKRGLLATLGILGALLFGPQRDVLVKSFRSALRARQGDHFRDVYFDTVLDGQSSYYKVEVVNSLAFSHQASMALRPTDADSFGFTFWGSVLGRLLPRREATAFCDDLARKLLSEVGVEVSKSFLLRRISSIYWESRLYSLLLARLQTRIVLVADTSEYALRRACFMRGIPFVEIQHGVFDDGHPDAVPDWVSGAPAELLLPDTLACYGPYWIEQLASSRQFQIAKSVGNDMVEVFRNKRAEFKAVADTNTIRLLFTSQGLDTSRAVAWLDALLNSAPVRLNARLIIKLHPAYDCDTAPYRSLVERHNAVLVVGAQEPNVWDLLTECDLHLSISSACHFDAAALGVPSVVMPLNGHYLMEAAIDGRSIFASPSPDRVWTLPVITDRIVAADMERFASPGFVKNMETLIDSLLASPRQVRSSFDGEVE